MAARTNVSHLDSPAPSSGQGLVFDGTDWVPVDIATQTELNAALLLPALSASLPGGPSSGTRAALSVTDGDGKLILQRFRYNAASAETQKWDFEGGPPLAHEVDESSGGNPSTTASTSYVAGTALGGSGAKVLGPKVTVPNSGVYLLMYGFKGSNSSAGSQAIVSPSIAGAAPADNPDGARIANTTIAHTATVVRKTLTAGDTVELQFKATGGTASFYYVWLQATPVRIA